MELTFKKLEDACFKRQKEWDINGVLDAEYFAIELGGEAGEALNVVKKLKRERLGLPGSRTSTDALADELADVVIGCMNLAGASCIDLEKAIVDKFNAKSEELGFETKL